MSFLPPNEQNQQAPQGQTTPNPMGAGAPPPAAGGSAGAGQAKGSATGTPTQFGSSASKLGDYLSTNAPQIQNQAQGVANGLNQQFGQVGTDINNDTGQFGQQVQAGYNAANPDVVNQALANPTQFASNPNNVSAFQGQLNDTYKGPQNFESTTPYGNIQNEVNTAVQNGGLMGTQAGLQSYFQNQYNQNGGGGNNNTQAISTLDSLLLGNNPTLQNAVGQFKQLPGQFQTATATADQGVTQAQQNAANIAAQTQGQFNPFVQNFGTGLTNAANTAEQGRTAYNTALNNYYNQLTPVDQQVQGWLGQLPGNSGAATPDIFANAINQNQLVTNPITTQNYSTPQQYAEAAALQQLAGQNNPITLPINASTANMAGTAPTVGSMANVPTLNTLINQDWNPLSNAFQQANQYGNQNGQGADFRTSPNSFGGVGIQGEAYNNLMQYLNNLGNQPSSQGRV